MARRDRNPFLTVTSTGGLLPVPVLERLATAPDTLPGTSPEDYELTPGKRLREIINRSWNDLLGAWQSFQTRSHQLASTDPGLALTRDRWLLPLLRELGWHAIEPANGSGTLFVDLDDAHLADNRRREWPITHEWGAHVAVHLLGWNVPLDTRTPGVPGAASAAPHSVVQDFLNAADTHLWGIVCNGRRLRILRDSTSLTRQAYVEFDLETMFDNQVFSDFVLLWTVVHATRFAPRPAIQDCWLEEWQHASDLQGVRALKELRRGVEDAIASLGTGLLAHPANDQLRASLRDGSLDRQAFYRQLLRLVYRLVFLFVIEDRDLLHLPDTDDQTRQTYARHYSTSRLRDQSGRHTGGRHPDGWEHLSVLLQGLSSDEGISSLGLPSLAGGLFDMDWTPDLVATRMTNKDLYRALRALAFTTTDGVRSRIDFRNLGSEELGSVYESLLELHPTIDPDQRTVVLGTGRGNERRRSGAYYTPTSLITEILDHALDPVIESAISGKEQAEAEQALLELAICDPACGSAHFLVAAAHRLAKYVAMARTGDVEPAPAQIQVALRDVVSRCIYGVDVNPMAVELAKVSLWLECHVPGMPLTFLDHHIKQGNSLFGVDDPELIDWHPTATKAAEQKGVYDAAFTVNHGDERRAVARAKKRNTTLRKAKEGRGALVLSFADSTATPKDAVREMAAAAADLATMSDQSLEALRAKRQRWRDTDLSPSARRERRRADAWCASFTIRKTDKQLDSRVQQPWDVYYAMTDGQELPDDNSGVVATEAERARHGFFHWYVEFPDIYERGGFDVMVGNPPWGSVSTNEANWFGDRGYDDIADAPNQSARNRLVAALAESDNPADLATAADWDDEVRAVELVSQFLKASGRYEYPSSGTLELSAVFADLFLNLIGDTGRSGYLCRESVAVGKANAAFTRHVLQERRLAAFYMFENEEKLFPEVHNDRKFAMAVFTGAGAPVETVAFTGFIRQPKDIHNPERRYELTPEEIAAINPHTVTPPIFRNAHDAEVTATIHRNVAVLCPAGEDDPGPWAADFVMGMFHMSGDSEHFRTGKQLAEAGAHLDDSGYVLPDGNRLRPLHEGKMVWLYDYRYGTYEGQTQAQANKGVLPPVTDIQHGDPDFRVEHRYWVDATLTEQQLPEHWTRDWLIGFRDKGTLERTMLICALPRFAAGHPLPLSLPEQGTARQIAFFLAALSSIPCDYAIRQKGIRMYKYIVQQAPVPTPPAEGDPTPWDDDALLDFVVPRVVELTVTSNEMIPFAADCDLPGTAFRWDPDRRAILQAELDALFAHVYGLDETQLAWILDTFRVLRENEEKEPARGGFGEFRTKRLVLERYDAMTKAIERREPYQSPVSVPAAHDSLRHGQRLQ